MKQIYAFLCLFLFSSGVYAEQWLCIGDQVAAFIYSESKMSWELAKQKPDKWIIYKATGSESNRGYVYGVRNFDHSSVRYKCEEGFTRTGDLICEDRVNYNLLFIRHFVFNRKTQRFTATSPGNYFNYEDTPVMTTSAHVEIGKCSSF